MRSEPATDAAHSRSTASNDAASQRPAWLEMANGRYGDVYYETVVVERYATAPEAEDALAEELQNRTRAYIDRYLGAGASKLFAVPSAYIHDHLVKDRYRETVESSVGPMVNAYAQLAFDRRARAQLQRMQRDAQIEHRLLDVAGGATAVLLVLGAVFGYLKLDTMTRGYYMRRLQVAAAVVILTVAAGAVYAVRSKVFEAPRHGPPTSGRPRRYMRYRSTLRSSPPAKSRRAMKWSCVAGEGSGVTTARQARGAKRSEPVATSLQCLPRRSLTLCWSSEFAPANRRRGTI